jgi:hypothetical protein
MDFLAPDISNRCGRAAWLLDALDHLAARFGDLEPIDIEDTDSTFATGWKGQYRLRDGPSSTWIVIVVG